MDKRIRWGIIGCGDVTEVKSGPALQKAEGSELAAVMRRNGELAKDYAARHGVAKWYDRAEALIADPAVDAVYVATPPSSHKEYAIAAARAGKPVYVEKPMAMNGRECEEMLPRFRKVKEWLDSGAIGDIRMVRTVHLAKPLDKTREGIWRVDPAVSGGGLFLDVGSHTLDLLDCLLGSIRDVSGHASNMGSGYQAEDTVSGRYVFESGVHGIGVWCFNAFDNEEYNEIVGTRGSIMFSTFSDQPLMLRNEQGTFQETVGNPVHIQQPLIQSIVDELLGKGTALSTGETAIRTSRVMEEMVRGYYA
jgi:1,5-anhydro-D-fructose reductase (1,5-anhydro-D-mannitol-forming)